MASSDRLRARQSSTIHPPNPPMASTAPPGNSPCPMVTSLSASGYGSGRSSSDSTTEKMAVLRPTPSASVRMATNVAVGAFRSVRNPKRTSWPRCCTAASYADLRSRVADVGADQTPVVVRGIDVLEYPGIVDLDILDANRSHD